MMTLSKQLQESLKLKVKQYEEEKKMPLVIRQLNRKIIYLSPELEIKIRTLSLEKLENLGEDLLDFNSVDDLLSWLDSHS